MTKDELMMMQELEKEYSEYLADAKTIEEKYAKCHKVIIATIYADNSDKEFWEFCKKHFPKINKLYDLYEKMLYKPENDEKELSYLFKEGMSKEQKLNALAQAYNTANNSSYCDSMASLLASGKSNEQTDRWQRNYANKYAIERYYEWLKEQKD